MPTPPELLPNRETSRISVAATAVLRALWTPTTGLILLTVAAIAVTVWCYQRYGKYRPFADLIDQVTNPEFPQLGLQMNDAVISVKKGGRRRFRVSAKTVTISRDRRYVTVDGLHNGTLYDDVEQPQLKFDGGRVIYQTPGGSLADTTSNTNITLTGGVAATTSKPHGPRIYTDTITWDSTNALVRAPGTVTITWPNRAGTAIANDVSLNARTRDILVRRIHGTFRVSKLVQ